MATLIPNRASAFWFFSTNASAAGSVLSSDPSTFLLKAATNIDPNPDKGMGNGIQTSDNAMLAYAGPSGSITNVPVSQPDRISVYVVRPGDTISEIATMFGVSVNTIVWANNLSSARDVHPGNTLIILPVSGTEHKVMKGDTLKSIAQKYGSTVTEIAQYNGLSETESLAPGSVIIIPGGEIAAPTPTLSVRTNTRRVLRGAIYEPYLGGAGPAESGYYGNPIPGGIITQGLHGWNGIDIGAPRGTQIYAAADGVVIIARNNGAWDGGYGNYVVISHPNNTQTLYAHMSHSVVSPGQSVQKGELIGYVGMTGMTTGPHVHFEVRGAATPLRNCSVGSVCSPQ